MSLRSFLAEWRELRRYRGLPRAARAIVFYAEDAGSWTHFEPTVRELTGRHGRDIAYLTSSPDDPVLCSNDARLHAFCIGEGTLRTLAFVGLDADVLVMTMPDLESFHIKRSKQAPVHYVYVFHSIVSTHMIYRREAFDHFDTVLCAGPHHVREIRAAEERYGLPPKRLVEHGYGRLDALLAERPRERERRPGAPAHVLVAPSWGPEGLLETRADELLDALLGAGSRVTVRPHPMTSRRQPRTVAALRERAAREPALAVDTDMSSRASLLASDVMVSDWSGAALEYAFGLERPVVFVDLPRKVNNERYEELGIAPVEVRLREEIGALVAPDALERLPAVLASLLAEPERFVERVRAARERHVFHVGRSGQVGADEVVALADGRRA